MTLQASDSDIKEVIKANFKNNISKALIDMYSGGHSRRINRYNCFIYEAIEPLTLGTCQCAPTR